MNPSHTELLDLNHKLLNAIVHGDWKSYAELCDPSLTAFEPEAVGQVVAGLEFHEDYFKLEQSKSPKQVTMCSPVVHMAGEMAVLVYVRLTQSLDASGSPRTSAVEETRVWQKKGAAWKHVHFHRSPIG